MNVKYKFEKFLANLTLVATFLASLAFGLPAYASGSNQAGTTTGREAGSQKSAVSPQTGSMLVTIYDGTRQPLATGTQVLIRVFDGKQKEIVSGFYQGPAVQFNGLPIHDNLDDIYRVVASTRGYNTEGVAAVRIANGTVATAQIMLLPDHGQLVFESWPTLRQNYPWLANLFAHGTASEEEAQKRYKQLMAEDPGALAALLNITTAGHQIAMDKGDFLSYFKEIVWQEQRPEWREHHMVGFNPTDDTEHTMRHDRFWAYADRRLVDQVKLGVAEGTFFVENGSQVFHSGATGSFKEKNMEEGHIHVSFYENDSRVIDGVDCVLLEIHIDLYKDILAHGFLEVIPNTLTGHLTEPEDAYQHRWISAINSPTHVDFDPPLVILPFNGESWHKHSSRAQKH